MTGEKPMKRWRVWHHNRRWNAIGKFVIRYITVEADSEAEALKVSREELEAQGYETAGGEAKLEELSKLPVMIDPEVWLLADRNGWLDKPQRES